jgi:N-methylhydantoinase B
MSHVDLVRLAGARGRLSEAPTVDPVTAEVVRGALETICFEMATYVSRTATTPILNQSNERNATILDGQGRLAALSVGIPQFMLTSTLPVRFALEFLGRDEFREGDVFVANDPYHGGGHLPDYNVFAPVFAPDPVSGQRRMVLIASIQCHHGDTGGGVPGGYNVTAGDIWGEGVRWPAVKVIDRGVERRDVLYALQANNRIPDYIGDLRAQIGAAQLACQRLGEVIEHTGVGAVV